MEVTFGKDQTKVEPVEVVEHAPAANGQSAVAVVPEEGAWPTFADVILPRINLVQNIGQLKDSFEPGSLVYDQRLPLFIPAAIDPKTSVVKREATAPLNVTALRFKPTRFAEKVVGGFGGMIVSTEDAVIKAGGTLDYSEWKLKESAGMKYFERLADVLLAVEQPEIAKGDETAFIYSVGDKKYALAVWGLKGTAYTALAKRIWFTAVLTGCLRAGGYPSWSYSISTRQVTQKGKEYWTPIGIPHEKNSPEFLTFVSELLTGK